MRSAAVLATLFVAGALSVPMAEKRDVVIETDWVTVVDVVTVDVAASTPPPQAPTEAATPAGQFFEREPSQS